MFRQPVHVCAAGLVITVAAFGSVAQAETGNDVQPVYPVVVAGHRLDEAVERLQDVAAGTVVRIERDTLISGPGGQIRPLGIHLLATPALAFNAVNGDVLRGQHDAVQYRIAGIALPDGAESFGDVLNGRFADHVDIVTGALPARYGPGGGGVIQVTPRAPPYEPGGAMEIYGGGRGAFSFGGELSGDIRGNDVFLSFDAGTDQHGVDGPTSVDGPLHDRTGRGRVFGFASRELDDNNRLSLVAGLSETTRQAPDESGRQPELGLKAFNISRYPSQNLNDSQVEQTGVLIGSWLYSAGDLDLQASAAFRSNQSSYRPDRVGDLLYTGLSQQSRRIDNSTGGQVDGVWRIDSRHQIGFGAQFQQIFTRYSSRSTVLRVASGFIVINNRPLVILDSLKRSGSIASGYLQDDWKLTDEVTLNAGVRFDRALGYTDSSALSPRASISWRPDPRLRFRLGYMHGFTPAPLQRTSQHTLAWFFNTTATSYSLRNDPPLPEEADELDASVDVQLDEFWSASVTGYDKTAKNLLDDGQFTAPLITIPFNYAKGRLSGFEARITWRRGPFQAWGALSTGRAEGRRIVSAQYNFSYATLAYVRNNWIPLDQSEAITGSSGIEWHGRDTSVSATATYGSGPAISRAHPNDATLDPRFILNLSAVRGFDLPRPLGAIDLRVDVFNALDRVYQTRDGTGLTLGGRQYGPRRELFLGLVKSF